MNDKLFKQTIDLYESKLATGNYGHYTDEMLEILLEDCIRQCSVVEEINNISLKRSVSA